MQNTFADVASGEPLGDDERLGDDRGGAHARVERGVGILEHRLYRLAIVSAPRVIERAQVVPLEADGAAARLFQPEHKLCGGGLTATRLADDAEGAPGFDRKRDPVDRAHHAAFAHQAAPDAEMLTDLGRFDECHYPAPPLPPAPFAASQQRAVRPSPSWNAGGTAARQRSNALRQRGAKAQPGGRSARSGGCPSIAVRRWHLSLMRGIELSSARV